MVRSAQPPGGRPPVAVRLLAGLICAAALTTGAHARPARPEANTASQVVVRARPGPALWRVTKGASELVILGSVTPTPEDATWNTRLVADALQGARLLMLSPGSTPGLAWADNFRESQRYFLGQPLGRTLAKELTPGAGARFDRLAAGIGRPPSRYGSYRPGPAGMILLEDSWRARRLTGSKLDDTVVGLARAARVRVVKIDEGGALPLIDAMPAMSRAQHAACLGEAMDRFEREAADAGVDFGAWAQGDLATLQRSYHPLSLCLDAIPGGLARRDKARAVWLRALSAALDVPGRTVAVVDVADLLEPSDLLAALQARGGVVSRPREPPVTGGRLIAARPVEEADPVLEDDARPAADDLVRVPRAVRVDSVAGGAVHVARGDKVCVEETALGTLFLHLTCHTQLEWTEIERHRSLDQARDLRNNRRSVGSGPQ